MHMESALNGEKDPAMALIEVHHFCCPKTMGENFPFHLLKILLPFCCALALSLKIFLNTLMVQQV